MKPLFAMVLAGSLVWGQTLWGSTRVVSVYIESLSAVQSTAYRAAERFASPELGTAPMMLNMMVPGFAQIDPGSPVGVHVFAMNEAGVAVVVDLKPLGAPEGLLGALMKSQGNTNKLESVDGRYELGMAVAQMHGERLLLGRNADELSVAMATGVPAGIPEVAGLLRVDVEPARLVPILAHLKDMASNVLPGEPEQQAMLEQGMDMYQRGLAQVARYQFGVGVGDLGLEIRGQITPQAGRALEKVIQSLRPVDLSWLARLERDVLFGSVSGAYKVPDALLQSLVDAYINLLKAMPEEAAIDADLMRKMFEPSLVTVGAPAFVICNVDEKMKFSMHGGMLLDQASDYLQEMIALIASDDYKALLEKSGMKVTDPRVRDVSGNPVYRWEMDIDKEALFSQVRSAGGAEPDAEDMEQIETMMKMFLDGYDYGATDKGLVFGMGTETGLEEAMTLLGGGASVEGASAIVQKVGAPVTPYAVAKLDLIGAMKIGLKIGQVDLPVAASTKGEGIWFSAWRSGGGVEYLTLIPAADIRLIRETAMSAAGK